MTDSHPVRILLVEDSRTQALVLTQLLKQAGHDVVWEASAEAALTRLNALAHVDTVPFDVLITDIGLPGKSGDALLRDVKADQNMSHLPVLVLSADDNQSIVIRCIEDGADDFLPKPVNAVLLMARVRSCVAKSALRARERDYAKLADFEKRRAEMLLFDLLPASVATRMMRGETRIADHHDDVTVLFADICGFTRFSATRSAASVVQTLDDLFGTFDDLCASLGVDKIKTIGDGYMAAGGLHDARVSAVVAVAELALAMRETARRFRANDGAQLQLRIGIHSGPVVAGVIGRRRHVFDIWGDTVNFASRMEATTTADTIQVSTETSRRLAPHFVVERRGVIDIRGKGPTETWLLHRSRGRRAASTKQRKFNDTVHVEAERAFHAVSQELRTGKIIDEDTGLLSRTGLLSVLSPLWREAAHGRRGLHVVIVRTSVATQQSAAEVKGLLEACFRGTDKHCKWDDRTFVTVGIERSATEVDTLLHRVSDSIATMLPPASRSYGIGVGGVRLSPDQGSSVRLFEDTVRRQIELLDKSVGDLAALSREQPAP